MRKIVLTFGLISGAILAAMMFATMPFHDQIGFDRGEIIGYTTMVLAGLLIFFGVRSFRDNVAGGTITFGRAFLVGIQIGAVAAVCYVAAWQIIQHKVSPDFMEKYQAHVLEKAKADGATEQQLAAQKADMEKFAQMYKNPVMNVAMTFMEPVPVALLISLVSAGVLSRKKKEALLANTPARAT